MFTSDDSFVDDEGPSKFDTVYFKESEDDKPYFVTIPESTNPEVGMIVLKPGAMLVLEEGPSPRFDVLVNIVMHYIISVPSDRHCHRDHCRQRADKPPNARLHSIRML